MLKRCFRSRSHGPHRDHGGEECPNVDGRKVSRRRIKGRSDRDRSNYCITATQNNDWATRRQQRSSSKILIQYSVHAASWLSFLVRRQNSTGRASERARPPSFLPYLRSAAVALPRSELGDNERCSSGGERMRLVKVGPVPMRYDGGTAPSKFRCVRGRKPTPTLGMMQDTRLESRSHG